MDTALSLFVVGPAQQVTVGVDADWVMPGDTILAGYAPPPLRLAPEVGSIAVRVEWERVLSPTLAVLAGMEAWFTSIAEDDQLMFLRAPTDGGRAAAGLRLDGEIVALEGAGGVDLVWPKGRAELLQASPYFAATVNLAPMPDVTLALGAESGIELADPVDSIAGQTASIDAGAAWSLRPDLTLSAKLAAWQEVGLFDAGLVRSRRTAMLGANWAASEHFTYGVTLSWSRVDGPAESYDRAGLALSLSGTL